MVVEDAEAVRALACSVLSRQGYRVLNTAGPQAALDIGSSYRGELNLVLADVVMPGMSGPEFVQLITTRFPTVKVLYISGYSDEGPTHMLSVSGASFLQKPFTPESLARKVREALGKPTG